MNNQIGKEYSIQLADIETYFSHVKKHTNLQEFKITYDLCLDSRTYLQIKTQLRIVFVQLYTQR